MNPAFNGSQIIVKDTVYSGIFLLITHQYSMGRTSAFILLDSGTRKEKTIGLPNGLVVWQNRKTTKIVILFKINKTVFLQPQLNNNAMFI